MTQFGATLKFSEDRLTRKEAAAYLGISAITLIVDAKRRHLLVPFYRVGRRCYYRRTELDAWLTSRRVGGAA